MEVPFGLNQKIFTNEMNKPKANSLVLRHDVDKLPENYYFQ